MFFDLHNDFPTVLESDRFGEYIKKSGGVVTAAIWTSAFGEYEAVDTVNKLTERLSVYGIPIAIEDLGFLERKYAEENFDFSRYFYCSLTWNYDNIYAGGAMSLGKLTARGTAIINRLNCFCALDTAHLNKYSFFKAVDAAKHPMCSHTGFNNCERCLDDEQIKAIINRHGIIGLSAVKKFSGASNVKDLAEVVDSFTQSYGPDALCLGTDFYGSDDLPDDFNGYGCIDALKNEMNKLGYTDEDTDKFLYKNAQLFYEEITNERYL
ncbi:MAG: membrane dipeptidase [Clostridiales bacterium]|nr:membrane dipeptidase [Clostridiales bacterium]